jgi:hypothetical protein
VGARQRIRHPDGVHRRGDAAARLRRINVITRTLRQPLEAPRVEVVVDEILGDVVARTLLLGRRLVAFEELEAVRFAPEALRLGFAARLFSPSTNSPTCTCPF